MAKKVYRSQTDYYKNNREERLAYQKEYRNTPERKAAHREYMRMWSKKRRAEKKKAGKKE